MEEALKLKRKVHTIDISENSINNFILPKLYKRMFMSHEVIDQFKYSALLGKLESIKGKNLPIHKFIKQVYELSNELKSHNRELKPQPETVRHAFMLINRATNYLVSKRPINADIAYCIKNNVPTQLMLSPILNASNVLETFEFWSGRIEIRPVNLNQVERLIPILTELHHKRKDINLTFITYTIEEFRSFYYEGHAVLTYFNSILGEDNIISKVLGTTIDKQHNTKMIEQAKLNLKVNQIILKELEHESSSTSITNV